MADVLGQGVHDGLMQVLDHAIVGALDVNADLGRRSGGTSVEAGDRYGAQAVITGPSKRMNDVG
jgi:hypothetical protein